MTVTTWMMGVLNLFGYATLLELHRGRPVILAFAFILTSGIIAVGYLVLLFYWRGRNWARWLVMASCLRDTPRMRQTTAARCAA